MAGERGVGIFARAGGEGSFAVPGDVESARVGRFDLVGRGVGLDQFGRELGLMAAVADVWPGLGKVSAEQSGEERVEEFC